MAGEWEQTTLADVSADVSYGYTESASDEKIGPRFLRITDIQNGVVDWHAVPYCPISESDHRKYRLHYGDIVVARTGNSTGENYLFRGTEDAVYASYLIRFRANQRTADPAFVWYNMRTRRWQDFINSSKTGSAQAGANAKVLGLFQFPLPPLAEQKAIASVLGALDDKIELNRRMNATLEAMARALFQSWFVDFDPVRAKLDGRPPAALDPATAALFPEHLEDSPLGHIPKGWEVKTADELSTVGIGKTPPRMDHHWFSESQADVPWMSIRDLGNAGVFISHTSEFLTAEAVEKFRVKRIPDNTVVLSFKLTMGRVAITDGEMLSNEAIAHFRLNPDTNFGSAYLYCYLVPDRKLRFYRDVYSPAPGNPGGFNSFLDNRRRVTGMNEIRSHSWRLIGALILGRAEPSPCGCG